MKYPVNVIQGNINSNEAHKNMFNLAENVTPSM